jgi:hypothetical protein
MLSCSRSVKQKLIWSALGLAALGLAFTPSTSAQVSVLTQNNDNARTGANTAETILTPTSVNTQKFGKLFTITGLDANVNGQTLYLPGVTINGASHNVLYAYTSNNTDNSPCGLNAFDADTGTALWHTLLPNSATYTTATPVIDPVTGTMYVLSKTGTDDTGATYLHAFDITTGKDKPGSPVQVQASAPGSGDGNIGGVVSFDGPASSGRFHADDRAGLLLLNGVVYTAFAHNSDSYPYHGWILGYSYNGTAFMQTAKFCTTPNGGDGGIWMAGKGLTADANGYIYCSVGNGTFDVDSGGPDYGMCYLKLRASDLSVADWFSPFDESSQSNADLDTGNSGIVGIPGTTRLFGGATKFGTGFLLDSTNLGHFTPNGPDKVVLRLNNLTGNDSVGQNPIAWDASSVKYVYLWANGSNLEQFALNPATGTFSPAGIYKQTSGLTSGGSLAVTASGTSGGILWGVGSDKVVRAFDATDVTKTPFWTSAQNSTRDGLPSVGHFQFPTVVNGKLYVPTGSASIAVYGLLPTTPPAPPPSNVVTQVRYFPRAGFASRMVGGKFQGSLDGTTYADLATIAQAPTAGQYTVLPLSTSTAYRYLRYLAPNGGYGNIAELEFDSGTGSGLQKLAGTLFGTPGSWQNHGNDFTKVFDGNTSTFFDAPDPGNGDYVGIDLGVAKPVYQIDAGGGAASPFAADSHVQGGSTYISGVAVSTIGVVNPAPQSVYQSERYGNFTYTLTGLTPGASYTLRLHFAEIYWNSAGARVFNVAVNSQTVLSNFDIFAAAGGTNKAIIESYTAIADSNGNVTVGFTTVKDNAKLSGLEVLH